MVRRLQWFVLGLVVVVGLIGLWQAIYLLRVISPVFMPGPGQVADAIWRGLTGGTLLSQAGSTISRMLIGWIFASLAGMVLGLLIGGSPKIRPYLQPSLEFLRPLPAPAVVPVAIAIMGLSDSMVLLIVVFGALWPVLLGTIHGVTSMEPRLYEVSRILRMSKREFIWKMLLPSAVPDILAGVKLGLGISLILTIVGEMLASRYGIGHAIIMAARSYRSADLYAGIVIIGVMGYLTTTVLSSLERRVLAYRTPVDEW